MKRILTLLVIGLSCHVVAQVSKSEEDAFVRSLSHKFGNLFWSKAPEKKFGFAWTTEPLRKSRKFSNIQIGVDKAFSDSTQGHQKLVDTYFQKVIHNQTDAGAIYAWAYSSMKLATQSSQQGHSYWRSGKQVQMGIIQWLLASNHETGDYDFIRLRFLMEGGRSYKPELETLAKRLLQVQPQDWAVMRNYGAILGNSRDASHLSEAHKLADRLLGENPRLLSYIHLKGYVYVTQFLQLGQKAEYGEKAIEWYEKYIQRAPNGSTISQSLRETIQALTASMKNGTPND